MKVELTDWDRDAPVDIEEAYKALVRSLRRRRGFGLLFVQGSPAEGERVIARVKKDLPQKRIEVLGLKQGVDNFYNLVEEFPNIEEVNILFVTGIEYSLYEYEEEKREQGWESKEIYSQSWKGVPRILRNLNQQRERFRDNFNVCFVFILPRFALDYINERAPDFFDWRSGLFEFPTVPEHVEQEYYRIFQSGGYQKYIALTCQERKQKICQIRDLLNHEDIPSSDRADLQYKLGKLLNVEKKYEAAIACFDKAIEIKPDNYKIWKRRGAVLCYDLECFQEAIASFDKAIEIEPNNYKVWHNRGYAMFNLRQYKKAIASYEKAIRIKQDDYYAWYGRGNALNQLRRHEEAIASYDKAIEIKADDYYSWNGRGNAMGILGRYEEAIASYDQAIEIADDYYSWNRKGNLLRNLGRYREAIASYDKAIEIKPDDHSTYYNKACCYALQGDAELAIENLQQAVELSGKEYLEDAKTDSDFDKIRSNQQFQQAVELLSHESSIN